MKKKIALCFFIFIMFIFTSCSSGLNVTSYQIYTMNTNIVVRFYNVYGTEKYKQALNEIYFEYASVSDDFDETSEISILNEKRTIEASDELVEMTKKALEMKEKTNGYYNPLIGRLAHEWKEAIDGEYTLDEAFVKKELEIMNSSSITIEGNKITINGDANLDLGGIAKGYATQKAKEYLDSQSITSYMIDSSSNNVLGTKAGNTLTAVMTDPYSKKIYKKYEGKNVAIGTSSPEYQYVVVNGETLHHLISPYTGYPANYYTCVNVLSDDSTLADAYSTALFVMDLETAEKFINENNIDAILYNAGILYETNGWKNA